MQNIKCICKTLSIVSCKTLSLVSELDFAIFGGIFLCVAAFLGFKSLTPNSISLNDTGSNLKFNKSPKKFSFAKYS